MSNFHERISLQAKMIRNRMNVSVQPERSITIPVSNLEAAIRPRVQKENVKNVSITVDSQGPQFQPEGSLTIPVKDLEATMRTSLQRNNPTSVKEITEAGEGSETKAINLESVSSKNRGNLECVSPEKRDDFIMERIKLVNTEREKKKNVTIRGPFYSVEKISNLFRPRAVSIGPVHRGLTNLQLMEDTKWAFLDALSDNEIGDCFERIKNLEESARRCYQGKIELSSDEFVQILFVDSMFIIFLLIDDVRGVNDSTSKIISGMLSYVFDDLLLLQNQIPFFIVKEMWGVVFGKLYNTDLATILQRTRFGRAGSSHSLVLDDICHLLDLYCKWVVPEWVVPILARVPNCQHRNWLLLRMSSLFPFWFSQPQTQVGDKRAIPATQSATELYEAGIKFKPKAEFMNFLDISFRNGILEIPTLTLNLSSISLFANVLSHVITNVVQQEIYVTSYVFFMDSLIRTEKDIVLLQKFGVLENKLKSGDEAVDFIKSLGECVGILPVYAVNENVYAPMIQDMMEYAASSWRRNWASLKHTYFSNPWKGISVIAGSSLLILGFVQTYYTAYPNYHHNN